MWLFLAFLLVPLIEIALFIQVGGWLGLWPTLTIVVATAALGTLLVRSQGARALADIRGRFDRLQDPTEPLAHGAMILFAGALLLTPGFFTDAVGFALLLPGVRGVLLREIGRRITVASTGRSRGPRHPHPRDDVIEGDYSVPPDAGRPTRDDDTPSGWRRH